MEREQDRTHTISVGRFVAPRMELVHIIGAICCETEALLRDITNDEHNISPEALRKLAAHSVSALSASVLHQLNDRDVKPVLAQAFSLILGQLLATILQQAQKPAAKGTVH